MYPYHINANTFLNLFRKFAFFKFCPRIADPLTWVVLLSIYIKSLHIRTPIEFNKIKAILYLVYVYKIYYAFYGSFIYDVGNGQFTSDWFLAAQMPVSEPDELHFLPAQRGHVLAAQEVMMTVPCTMRRASKVGQRLGCSSVVPLRIFP